MIPRLFADEKLTSEELLDNIEANCVSIEPNHTFTKSYTDEEMEQKQAEHLSQSKQLMMLNAELKKLVEPIKAKIKPLVKERERLIQNITKGGEDVTEKVYLYPDYESKMMGTYDSRGFLLSTRPFTMAERQLSLNSSKTIHLNKAI